VKNGKHKGRTALGKFAPGNKISKGRPPGWTLTSMMREKLESVPAGEKQSYADKLVQSVMDKALVERDHHSQKMIMNYIDGMPKEKGEVDLNVKFVVDLGKPKE